MLSSIELDDETSIGTTKINDVSVDGYLPFEFQIVQSAIPETEPKHTLGISLIAPRLFGEARGSIHRSNPLTPTLSPSGRGSSLSSRQGSNTNSSPPSKIQPRPPLQCASSQLSAALASTASGTERSSAGSGACSITFFTTANVFSTSSSANST